MAVSKREYNDHNTRRPVWGYDFMFGCKRYRKAGYASQAEALRAEQDARAKGLGYSRNGQHEKL